MKDSLSRKICSTSLWSLEGDEMKTIILQLEAKGHKDLANEIKAIQGLPLRHTIIDRGRDRTSGLQKFRNLLKKKLGKDYEVTLDIVIRDII